MPKFKTFDPKDKPPKQKRTRRTKAEIEAGDAVDYSKVPKLTDAQFYNWQVYGTLTAPKPKND